MATEEKTHWKKRIDSRYISGEDLKFALNGLKPEMNVVITSFKDTDSFDQKKQEDTTVTALFLKEIGGNDLYKPNILNKTNAKFISKELGSDYMEEWIGKPLTMYAKADKRFDWVVRFKKFSKPNLLEGTADFEKCKKAIDSGSYTIENIKGKYSVSAKVEQLLITK